MTFLFRRDARGNAGFMLAPLLYMLALAAIGAAVMFSGYSQILRSNAQMTAINAVRSQLDAAGQTLSASSVLDAATSTIVQPPAPYAFGSVPDSARLPTNYTNAGSTGSPNAVGVIDLSSGVRQLDPWGKYYVYCQWYNPVASPALPAIMVISAGPDGNLDTKCGDTTAQGDDKINAMTVAEAINRANVWQVSSSSQIKYGLAANPVAVNANGALQAAMLTLGSAAAATNSGQLSAVSANISGALTAGSTTFSGATITGNETVGGTLGVTGAATFSGTLSAGATSLSSLTLTTPLAVAQGGTGAVTAAAARTDLGSTAVGDAVFVAATTAAAQTAIGGTAVGEAVFTAATTAAAQTAIGGTTLGETLFTEPSAAQARTDLGLGTMATQNANAVAITGGSITGVTFTGNITGNASGSAGSVPASGVTGCCVAISAGGTNAGDAATARSNLGTNNASNLTTGTVSVTLLPTSGVTPGTYTQVTVDVYGRVTIGANVNSSQWTNSGSNIYFNTGDVSIGTTVANTELNVYNASSATLTDFTQALSKGAINVLTNYTANNYTPGVFWSATDDNATKPKAGIWLKEAAAGTTMYLGTSNAYATGITNQALSIDQNGVVTAAGGFVGNITGNVTGNVTGNLTGNVTGNVSGSISLSDGSAASPGLYFTNDTNTGLYRPGADVLGIAAGGNDVARFTGNTSAVNYLNLSAATTGNAVTVAAAGTDTDVGITLTPKGAGNVQIVSGQILVPAGSTSAPSYSFTGVTNSGLYQGEGGSGRLTLVSNGSDAFYLDNSNHQAVLPGAMKFGFASSGAGSSSIDTMLTRQGAANLHLGAADAAAPVAQTLGVQGVVAGTSNTAGANFTINGSQGTGTGAGGALVFQTAPAGSTGTAQNALSEAMRITSAGYVGIGTTSPTNILSLGGQSAQTFWMERETTAATAGNNLTVQSGGAKSGGTNLAGGDLVLSSGTSTGTGTSNITFKTFPAGATGTADNTATTAVTITGAGKVGIGTSSPAATALLDLTSTTLGLLPPRMTSTQRDAISSPATGLTIYNTSTNELEDYNGGWVAVGSGIAATNFAPGSAGSPGLYVTGDSDTGFYSPAANTLSVTTGGVEVMRWNTIASGVDYFSFTPGAAGSPGVIAEAAAGSDTDISIAIMPKGAGKVGIGTATPADPLEVDGSGSTTDAGAIAKFNSGTATAGNIYGIQVNKTGTETLYLGVNKNTTTGSVPASSAYISTYTSTGTISIGRGGDSGNINTSDLFINSTGKVGIGTTGPNHKLDVNGNIGMAASSYLNWGSTDGTSGYGIRDNGGNIEVKNSGGSWGAPLTANQTITLTGDVTGSGTTSIATTIAAGHVTNAMLAGSIDLTSKVTGTLPVANGGTGTATAFTQGSIVYAGASGVYSQDNANFLWDATNHRLGVGTTSPGTSIDVLNNNPNGILIRGNSSNSIGLEIKDTITSGHDWSIYSSGGGPSTVGYFGLYDNTAAANRMVVDTSGNVGIGTTGPMATLDVSGTIAANYQSGYQSRYSTGSAVATLAKVDTGTFGVDNGAINQNIFGPALNGWEIGNSFAGIAGNTQSGNYDISFHTNNAEEMRITSSGNVGIGTTSIAQTYAGFREMELHGSTQGGLYQISTAAADGDGTQIGQVMWVDVNSTAADKTAAQITGVLSGSTANNRGSYLEFGTKSNNASGVSERMRIDNSGNVGINQTSPGSTLDVKGTLRLSGATSGYVGIAPAAAAGSTTYTLPTADGSNGQALTTNGSGTLSWASPTASASGASGYVQFSNGSALSSDSNFFWDNTNKRLGIGTTSPQQPLSVSSSAAAPASFTSTSTSNMSILVNSTTGHNANLQLQNAGVNEWYLQNNVGLGNAFNIFGGDSNGNVDVLTILQSGNVGIGTTNPGYTLDVNGTLHSSGAATVDGNFTNTGKLLAINNGTNANYIQFGTNAGGDYYNWYVNSQTNGSGVGTRTMQLWYYPYDSNPSCCTDILNFNGAGTMQWSSGYQWNFNGGAAFADNDTGIRFPYTGGYKIQLARSGAGTGVGMGVNGGLVLYGDGGNPTLMWKGPNGYGGANVFSADGSGNGYFAGNVGIGTTTPGYNGMANTLTVQSPTTRGMLELVSGMSDAATVIGQVGGYATANTAGNGTQVAAMLLRTSGATAHDRGGRFEFYTKANGSATFNTGMAIDENGNVGIGTTSPSYKLDVNGAARIANAVIVNGGSSSNWGRLNVGGQIQSSGSIYSYDSVCVGNNSGNCDSSGGVVLGKADGIVSLTTGTSYFNGGNVGIGQTSPHAKLDISSNGGSDGIVIYQQADNTETIQTYIDGHWSDRTTYAGGCCNVLALEPDVGNVGIGTTSPGAKLEVNGSIRIPDDTSTGKLQIGSNGSYLSRQSSDGSTILQTGQAYLLLNPTGNYVGIGTTGPSHPLHVYSTSDVNTLVGENESGSNSTYGVLGYGTTNYYGALGRADGFAFVGVGTVWATGPGLFNQSDGRLKENIVTLTDNLAKLEKLRPVSYTWKPDTVAYTGLGKTRQLGFIAQEVKPIVPEAVIMNKQPPLIQDKNGKKFLDAQVEGGTYGIEYSRFVPILVGAVKELNAKLDKLVADLVADVKKLAARVDEAFTRLAAHDSEIKNLEDENKQLRDAVCKLDATAKFCHPLKTGKTAPATPPRADNDNLPRADNDNLPRREFRRVVNAR
jgi:hypothetical protein